MTKRGRVLSCSLAMCGLHKLCAFVQKFPMCITQAQTNEITVKKVHGQKARTSSSQATETKDEKDVRERNDLILETEIVYHLLANSGNFSWNVNGKSFFCFVQLENSLNERIIRKGSPLFPFGTFRISLLVPFTRSSRSHTSSSPKATLVITARREVFCVEKLNTARSPRAEFSNRTNPNL